MTVIEEVKVKEKHLPTVAIVHTVGVRRHIYKESGNRKPSVNKFHLVIHCIPDLLWNNYQTPCWIYGRAGFSAYSMLAIYFF